MAVIGVLTAGGDCPGLNAVIRGVTARALNRADSEVWASSTGGKASWTGTPCRSTATRCGASSGGRHHPGHVPEGPLRARRRLQERAPHGTGQRPGRGSCRRGRRHPEDRPPPRRRGPAGVGSPRPSTTTSPQPTSRSGSTTAVQIATDAIDRLTTTAGVPQPGDPGRGDGRTKGWIATYAGLAGGADAILIPESPSLSRR